MDKQRFGRLTLLGEAFSTYYGAVPTLTKNWRCVCDCGVVGVWPAGNVRRGLTKSCGCYRREWAAAKAKTHGQTGTPPWGVWLAMKRRCHNKNCKDYALYGGRGITVCHRWRESFENFRRDMGPRPLGTSIDRLDFNGNYEPSNCRWATQEQQQNNKRTSRLFEHQGARYSISQLARKIGRNPRLVRYHLVLRGRSADETVARLTRP